jgi:hypothetical protein
VHPFHPYDWTDPNEPVEEEPVLKWEEDTTAQPLTLGGLQQAAQTIASGPIYQGTVSYGTASGNWQPVTATTWQPTTPSFTSGAVLTLLRAQWTGARYMEIRVNNMVVGSTQQTENQAVLQLEVMHAVRPSDTIIAKVWTGGQSLDLPGLTIPVHQLPI